MRTGTADNYQEARNQPWRALTEMESILIEEKITSVGEYAFANLTHLKKVEIWLTFAKKSCIIKIY